MEQSARHVAALGAAAWPPGQRGRGMFYRRTDLVKGIIIGKRAGMSRVLKASLSAQAHGAVSKASRCLRRSQAPAPLLQEMPHSFVSFLCIRDLQ